MDRGTGITTKQLKEAPKNSIFIWLDNHLSYPKRLCFDLGRKDIEVVQPSWIESDRWRGRVFGGIIVDHATILTNKQYDILAEIKSRIRLN